MDFNDLQNLAEAYTQVNQQLDEAEGSYGKTPKAREAMGKLAIARREKPASEYSQKGEKTKKVKEIEKHTRRIDNGPDVGNRGKKSTKPRYSGMLGKSGRGELDQDSRDYARDSDVEYTAGGHKPGPGTVTKNPKKLRKQKAMGEFAKEDFDVFDIVLEFLQVEGYAETLEEAEWLMVNELDEEDIESILEAEGSYGETPKAYSAAFKTKMTAKRKPFLKKMLRRTNPAERKSSDSPRKGMTDSDREESRAGAAHGSPRGHDYPSQGPGGVTKNPKKLRKQKAMGEFAKEDLDTYEFVLSYLLEEGYASTEQSADKIILNMSESWFEDIVEARRSEKEGKGSPEYRTASGHLVGQRAEKKRKGEMGGRHFWSGGEGGSDSERGKKKVKGAKADENKYTQHGRNSVFQGRTEKPGKYSTMQSRKRGSEMGSRFD